MLSQQATRCFFAGLIDGRNIWVADLESKLKTLESITAQIPKERVVITTSCSLLHVPFGKDDESKMDSQILSWISFAKEKT